MIDIEGEFVNVFWEETGGGDYRFARWNGVSLYS
jgi:hypothetical protein